MAIMSRALSLLSSLPALSLMLTACGPEKVVQWSHDGEQAAVVNGSRLYLCDDRGNVSKALLNDVAQVAWLPDSRRMAVVFRKEIDDWEELVRMAPLDFDEKKIAAAAITARDDLLRYEGKLDDFRPSNGGELTTQQWTAAILFLVRQGDVCLKDKLGKEWEELAELKVEVRSIRILPASGLVADGPPLFATLNEIQELRPAPDGGALACVTQRSEGWDGENVRSLLVIPSMGSVAKPQLVADGVAAHPDWCPDGRAVAYLRRSAAKEDGLGRIARRTVRDTRGTILAEAPPEEVLAAAAFHDTLRIRCLRDGRLLFAAADISLPVAIAGVPGNLALFYLDPSNGNRVKQALPPSAHSKLPSRVDLFELSPDERQVVVPGAQSQVSVASLVTGEVTPMIEGSFADLRMIPVWRNSDELCLMAPAGSRLASPDRPEVLLWSARKAIPISRHWPDETIQ